MLWNRRATKSKQDSSLGWTLARAPCGEIILALPSRVGPLKAPVIFYDGEGTLTIRDAASPSQFYQLATGEADAMIASSRSIIVGSMSNVTPALSVAPIIKKGLRPDIRYASGKIHNVTVERVSDDGMQTGIWRGFVKVAGQGGQLFLELNPAFGATTGTNMRVVGVVEETNGMAQSPVRGRFKRGAWVPIDERLNLFAADLLVDIGSSHGDTEDSREILAQCLDESALIRQGRRLERVKLPFTCRPLWREETPAQKGLRRRMLASNEQAQPTRAFTRGRRMAISATDWHGSVLANGDLIIEVRRMPFEMTPDKVTVIVSREVVSTRDALPSRIGVRCQFPDGSVVSMLLGGGPQDLAVEIAKRKNIVVVQGAPDAKTYAEISAFVANVEKR